VAQAFAGEHEAFEDWVRGFGDGVRLLREGPELQAGLAIYPMGQFFGGASVPAWGVAGVAVKPELRAKGYAHELMLAHLRENFESGPPISTLYPAAPRLYRNLGWEFAGTRCLYGAALSELPTVDAPGLTIREGGFADWQVLQDLYRQRYSHENGCLDRGELNWLRVRRAPKETPLFCYLAERDGVAEGYVMYVQKRQTTVAFNYHLIVHDLVCTTSDAADALLAFLAGHRSVARRVQFFAAPDDPLLLKIARSAEIPQEQRTQWMLRIVRVKEALEARGYAPHVVARAVLNVTDDSLPGNTGGWTLELADGRMKVKRGGKGGAKLDVRGLAAMYSSSLGPAQLRTAGLLNGTDKNDDALAAMFAGTAPWMPDFF
jgi:predicted acetyltransferase